MYGLIHTSLSKYVMAKYDIETWKEVLAEAGCGGKVYLTTLAYPDQEIAALIRAIAKKTLSSVEKVLEGFGEFIAPDLIGMYKTLIDPEWRTSELLLNTEEVMHRVVRIKNPGPSPRALSLFKRGRTSLSFFMILPGRCPPLPRASSGEWRRITGRK